MRKFPVYSWGWEKNERQAWSEDYDSTEGDKEGTEAEVGVAAGL